MIDKKGRLIFVNDWILAKCDGHQSVGCVVSIDSNPVLKDMLTLKELTGKTTKWIFSTSLLKLSEQESLLYMLEQ